MSYCRFSTNDYQCDVYCYESCYGGYQTEVASRRYVFTGPLPPPLPNDQGMLENVMAFYARHDQVRKLLDVQNMVKIGLAYDGASFVDDTLEEFLERLQMLRTAGYNIPDYVFDDVREEIAFSKLSEEEREERSKEALAAVMKDMERRADEGTL